MRIQILYEDNHLIVINKPFGELVHFDKTGDTPIEDYLKAYLKSTYNKPGNVFLKAVHRLDRPVSGVLIFAKTTKGLERMAKLFHDKKVRKIYWALTLKQPNKLEGEITEYLDKNRGKNVVRSYPMSSPGRKKAITRFRLIGKFGRFYLSELRPVTGRSHQLRVLMSGLGSPICGDMKYGGGKISNGRAILLHARSIEFMHPVKKKLVRVSARPPRLSEWSALEQFISEEE